eukprot:SAG11_NODE_962_length_6376_cov_3.798471_2_plen_493_part_00
MSDRERLGYLGDAHSSLETALSNVASERFYAKWLQDMLDIQGYPAHSAGVADQSGYIAHTAPTIAGGGGPAWSGFVIVMPWEVYLRSGDERILRRAYDAQLRLMGFWKQSFNNSGVLTRWGTGADGDNYLGDHATPHGNEGSAGEEADLLNNCYVLYCTRIMSNVSALLANVTGAAQFAREAEAHAIAIHKRFFKGSIQGYVDTRQGHLILALISGAVPLHLRESVLATLRHEIHVQQGGHIDTGMTTTYLMYKYFADSAAGFGGHEGLAHTLTTATGHPGYLAILDNGSTTFPEHWGYCHDAGSCCMEADWRKSCCERVYQCQAYNGCTEGKCTTSAGSSSLIHGTLNGVGQLFVSGIGGIRRPMGGVGYQTIEFRAPFEQITNVTHARATYRSLYGMIESSWSSAYGVHHHNVTVPPNCVAKLRIPGWEVRESGALVQTMRDSDGVHVVTLGSGEYAVSARYSGSSTETDDLHTVNPKPVWKYDQWHDSG